MMTSLSYCLLYAHIIYGSNLTGIQVHALSISGIFSGMSPCGIVLFVSELFISESLSQVNGILHDLLQRSNEAKSNLGIDTIMSYILMITPCTFAEHIFYDHGCHLKKFVRNSCRKDVTTTTSIGYSSIYYFWVGQ